MNPKKIRYSDYIKLAVEQDQQQQLLIKISNSEGIIMHDYRH